MIDTVYVVTSGRFSDYYIEAVFKDKTKAEFFCSCREDCRIQAYHPKDSCTFTPYNVMCIVFDIFEYSGEFETQINFEFRRLSKEDAPYLVKNDEEIWMLSSNYIRCHIIRRLPDNYDENQLKDKYTVIYENIRVKLMRLIESYNLNSIDGRNRMKIQLAECLREQFGIEMEDE